MTEQKNDGRILVATLNEKREPRIFYFMTGKVGEYITVWKVPVENIRSVDKDNKILEENARNIKKEKEKNLQKYKLSEREGLMESKLDEEYDVDVADEADYGKFEKRIDAYDDEEEDDY